MPIEAAINSLNYVINSIREAIWLIDLSAEETKTDELSASFRSRIGNVLSGHLEETIITIEYTQDLIRSIEESRSNKLPSDSSSVTDSDRSTIH